MKPLIKVSTHKQYDDTKNILTEFPRSGMCAPYKEIFC